MVSIQFETILKDFEPFFHCSLQPDHNNSCLIKMGVGISIQMELNSQDQLLIGCRVGTLPFSRYRDQLIRAALKSNETSGFTSGIFGFSQKSHQLILYLLIPPQQLTSDKISSLIPLFITKAKLWADALVKGEIPIVEQKSSLSSPMGAFGSL